MDNTCLSQVPAYPNQTPPHLPNKVINQTVRMQILIVLGAGSVSRDIMIAIYLHDGCAG